jgi:hypothetical protein
MSDCDLNGLLRVESRSRDVRIAADRSAPLRPAQRLGAVQPDADAQNQFLARHGWQDYASWHLGLTVGRSDGTKSRYAFVYGDFRRIHRSALIACVYRASEWRHKQVELAAHELLQRLDARAGIS